MSLFCISQHLNNDVAQQPALEIQNATAVTSSVIEEVKALVLVPVEQPLQQALPETFTALDGEVQTVISQESFGEVARLTETVNAAGETCLHAELVISATAEPITLEEVTAQTKESKASPTIKGEANKPLVASKTVMSEALERANERNKRNKPRSR